MFKAVTRICHCDLCDQDVLLTYRYGTSTYACPQCIRQMSKIANKTRLAARYFTYSQQLNYAAAQTLSGVTCTVGGGPLDRCDECRRPILLGWPMLHVGGIHVCLRCIDDAARTAQAMNARFIANRDAPLGGPLASDLRQLDSDLRPVED